MLFISYFNINYIKNIIIKSYYIKKGGEAI